MCFKNLASYTLVSLLMVSAADADIIEISNNTSGSFLLYSHSLGDLFGSDEAPDFSTDQLALAHEELMSWGIDTDGKITVLPVDTNQGFAFLTLIDKEYGNGDVEFDASLGLTSTVSDSLNLFINDINGDDWTVIQSPWLPSQTLSATFLWDSLNSGDGFAWAGLSNGDSLSYSFVNLGGSSDAIDTEAFQFVGWQNNGWEVISTSAFKNDGTSVFTGSVIPAPPTILLLTAITLGYRRRRINS